MGMSIQDEVDELKKENQHLKEEIAVMNELLVVKNKEVELIVFTNTGKTYLFKGVENLQPTTQGFEFEYTGVATGVTRKASFNYISVAGYAIN